MGLIHKNNTDNQPIEYVYRTLMFLFNKKNHYRPISFMAGYSAIHTNVLKILIQFYNFRQ